MQWVWYLPSLVVGLGVGAFTGNWLVAMMSGMTALVMLLVQRYRKTDQANIENEDIFLSRYSIAIGNRVLPSWPIFWKPQWDRRLFEYFQSQDQDASLDSILERIETEGIKLNPQSTLPLWLGVGEQSEIEIDLAKDGPHAIVIGPTGSGKSELIRLAMLSLKNNGCQLALFDFKGGSSLAEFESYSIGLATDLDSSTQLGLWARISNELTDREELFALSRSSAIEDFTATVSPLPRLVVVIDEFSAAINSSGTALKTIEAIVARGRSLGIHLIAATQSLSGIPRSLITNLGIRIAMRSADEVDLVQLGIKPQRNSVTAIEGWAEAFYARGFDAVLRFRFPLGFRPKPQLAEEPEESGHVPPSRSQLLNQMYLDQEQELDPSGEPTSNHRSQLRERMEGLR